MIDAQESVVLCDSSGNPTGVMDKLEAHRKGLRHLAFSVIIVDYQTSRILLHQRAYTKYHSPGLWTNACCGHPRPGETIIEAAHRRLFEEMSIRTELVQLYTFAYRIPLENNLIEHEVDHVFLGQWHGIPLFNPAEANDYEWVHFDQLKNDMDVWPEEYSYWFKLIFKEMDSRGYFGLF